MIKTIFLVTFIVIGEVSGTFFVFRGCKMCINGKVGFSLKNLFASLDGPIDGFSGPELIVVGACSMLSGVGLYLLS